MLFGNIYYLLLLFSVGPQMIFDIKNDDQQHLRLLYRALSVHNQIDLHLGQRRRAHRLPVLRQGAFSHGQGAKRVREDDLQENCKVRCRNRPPRRTDDRLQKQR